MATQPQLGYNQKSEVAIDQVNQWMRQTPWYQQQMRAWGQDPGHPTLTKTQSQQILKMAQGQGVVVDEGDMEVDDHGNFNPKGHKLRNTLIVAGIAAATIATAGAAGAFSAAAAPSAAAATSAGTLAATTTVPLAAGTIAGGTGLAAATAAATAPAAASTFLGLSSAELARYGLGAAGNVVNSIIQSRQQGKQFDEQQALLAQALAYQKEQDAFTRARQTGLDQQDVNRYAYTTGVDASRYGDTQQTQLADWTRNENRYAYSTDLEASRYSDYSKRIAPYLQAGASANDRAVSLLGLPAGAPFDPTLTAPPVRKVSAPPSLSNPGTGFGGGPAPSQRVPIDAATQAAIRAALKASNSNDNPASWDEYVSSHGDSSTKNWAYWANRIATGDGVGKGYQG